MIISASYRTDIPAYHGDWFLGRLEAGFVEVANPYGGVVSRVSLAEGDVDGFVFWTRNPSPFLRGLEAVATRGFPFVVQFTITGLPDVMEPAAPPTQRAVTVARTIADRWGPKVVVWRHDPIVITSITPPAWHLARFAELAAALRGVTDEVVVSFVQPYRKTRANMDRVALAGGFTWMEPSLDERRALLTGLSDIASDHDMLLTTCTQPDLVDDGVAAARCVDAARLSAVAGRTITAPTKGNRPGCLCAASRDIGAYDTCAMGCAYCYAVRRHDLAARRVRDRDPTASRLG